MIYIYGCEYCDCTYETDIKSSKYKCFACKNKLIEKSCFGTTGCFTLNDSNTFREKDLVVIPEIKTRKLLKRG